MLREQKKGRCAIWNFTKYGFFSVVAAKKKSGEIDNANVMIRARDPEHWRRLQARFPALAAFPVTLTRNADYGSRCIVPVETWVTVAAELARESVSYGNFKNEVMKNGSVQIRASTSRNLVDHVQAAK